MVIRTKICSYADTIERYNVIEDIIIQEFIKANPNHLVRMNKIVDGEFAIFYTRRIKELMNEAGR
jgi:hypothetical protein